MLDDSRCLEDAEEGRGREREGKRKGRGVKESGRFCYRKDTIIFPCRGNLTAALAEMTANSTTMGDFTF